MNRMPKHETAEEYLARMSQDAEWVRRKEDREAHFAEVDARLSLDEAPLLADLSKVGRHVSSVWDLVNTKASYPEAIPVLCEHLTKPYHPVTREGIIRALTVKEARGLAGRMILDELKLNQPNPPTPKDGDPKGDIRFVLANALTVLRTPDMRDEIEALLQDPGFADQHDVLRRCFRRKSR